MAENVNPEGLESAESAQETDAEGILSARDRFQRLSDQVQDRYKKVSDDVRRGAERAQGEIRRGAERAQGTYRNVADSARENYGRVAETARERYGKVTESAREKYGKVRGDAGNYAREVGFYVRDNPGKSVLMAAGVGFLLGLLVRRGDRDEDEI